MAQISDFNFGIPSGATIDGIEVQVEFRSGATSARTANVTVSLSYDNGSNWTSGYTQSVTGTTDVNRTYGGATDTWGRTWTDAELADGTFQVKISGVSADFSSTYCYIDCIKAKVYYTEATNSLSAGSGSFSLTGQTSLFRYFKIVMAGSTFSLTGRTALFRYFTMVSNYAPFVIYGQEISLTYTPVSGTIIKDLINFGMIAFPR